MRRKALAFVALLLAGAAWGGTLPDDLRDVAALLQPLQRATLQAQADIWSRWSAAQRDAFADRARDWDARPVRERGERRAAWAAWQRLPPSEQAQLRNAAATYAALDPLAQQALRAQFDALDGSTRHGWRLGPVLGADYARLQPLLAQVPVGEDAALLRTLRAMDAIERGKLAVLVQRTPPQARDALRRDLVSTSAANRAAWLMLRLER